jgi:hypothetical protein
MAEASSGSSTAESSVALRLTSLVPSLFQISNSVKFDASLDDDDRDLDSTTATSESARASSFTRSTSTNGRGGAMLVKPKTQPPPSRRIFQWLAPLETDRVAPLADRLIVDDGDAITSRTSGPNTGDSDVGAHPTSYVPNRAESGPSNEGKATTKFQPNRTETDGQPYETSSKTESLHQQLNKQKPEIVQSTGAPDTSEDVSLSSALELEVNVGVNDEIDDVAVATPLYNASHGSTAESDAAIVPESPYVSSGYVSFQYEDEYVSLCFVSHRLVLVSLVLSGLRLIRR